MLVHSNHKTNERDYVKDIVVKHGLEGRDLSGLEIVKIRGPALRQRVRPPCRFTSRMYLSSVWRRQLESLPLPEAPRAVYQVAMQNLPQVDLDVVGFHACAQQRQIKANAVEGGHDRPLGQYLCNYLQHGSLFIRAANEVLLYNKRIIL